MSDSNQPRLRIVAAKEDDEFWRKLRDRYGRDYGFATRSNPGTVIARWCAKIKATE